MRLSQQIIAVIIGIATLALLGLVSLQVYLLRNAFQLKEQTFGQSVRSALNAVARQLETQELVAKVISFSTSDSSFASHSAVTITVASDGDTSWTRLSGPRAGQKIRAPGIYSDSLNGLRSYHGFGVVLADSTVGGSKNTHYLNLKKRPHPGSRFQFTFTNDSSYHYFTDFSEEALDSLAVGLDEKRKRVLVNKVLEDFSLSRRRSIGERVDVAALDSLMRRLVEERDIETEFSYGIVSLDADSVILAQPQTLGHLLPTADFRTRLFPNDLFATPAELVMYFPHQDFFLLKQIALPAIVSVLLILVVAAVFVYTIRTIFKQRAFSERLTNFINNMTHEFKTPISTISLAAESMQNPVIHQNETKLLQYAGIIKDENTRMQNQVDKILQMAVIEEGDYELNLAKVNIHELIKNVIQSVSLQVEKKKGSISSTLNATRHVVQADALHFSNVIHNLLDNAIKYTRGRPEIKIATENVNGSLKISIADNGIGLQPDEKTRVFEKYYRVPTGNVHDVKGFGLGLSYVKLLVEAHSGTIDLRSQLDKGTVFDIQLPLSHGAEQNPTG